MKREDYADWFKKLVEQSVAITYSCNSGIHYYNALQASTWISETSTAVAAVFPTAHAINQEWKKHNETRDNTKRKIDSLIGVVKAAHSLIAAGKMGGLIDTIRIETEDELLDQAQALLNVSQSVAATVLAGGALETHLRHLVDKHNLTITGGGSISKYNDAIAQARKEGAVTIYEQTDSKLVTAWGGMRNDAAHAPGAFIRSADELRRMIEGVREFISRTS